MHARGMIAARAKAAQNGRVTEATGLERRRGLVNFLTWAFFLGEILQRDGVVSSSAHAADGDEPASSHGTESVPLSSETADRPLTSISDPGETVTMVSPGYTYSLPHSGAEARALDTRGFEVGQGSDAAMPVAHAAAGSVSTGGDTDVGTSLYASEPMAQHDAHSADAALPLVHASIAPDGLLHDVADTVGTLPIVGDLLGSTLHTVASTVGNLVGGLGGILTSPGPDAEGALASGGSIAFDAGPSSTSFDELQTSRGSFTDYGIALELNLSGGNLLSLAPSTAMAEPSADLAHFGQDHDGSHFTVSSDANLNDEAGQRSTADVLA